MTRTPGPTALWATASPKMCIRDRASFLRQLTDLTEEFYAYEIGPQALYRQVEDLDGAMGGKLRDIALIYAAYDARLRSGDFDARSRLQKLREDVYKRQPITWA